MRIQHLLVAAVIGLGVGASAQAAPLFTWDNSGEGWGGIDSYSTTVGVTEGTHSAVKDADPGFKWPVTTGNWAAQFAAMNTAQKTNTTILLDITATAETLPTDMFYYFDIWVWDSNNAASGIGQVAAIMDGQPHTYAFDFAAAGLGGAPSIDWTQVRITSNTTWDDETQIGFDPGPIYLDNFRIVPEPASLALLGLGGLALCARRRA